MIFGYNPEIIVNNVECKAEQVLGIVSGQQ